MKKVIIASYAFLIAFMAIGICVKADTIAGDNFSWNWLENASTKDYSSDGNMVCGGGEGWDGLKPWYSGYLYGDHVVTIYNELTGRLCAISFESFYAKTQNNYDDFVDTPFSLISPSNTGLTIVAEDWYSVFPQNESPIAVWWCEYVDYFVEADFYIQSAADLYMQLEDWGFEWNEPNMPSNDEPKFYLKTAGNYRNCEYTISWDTHGSYAAGKENQYGISVYIAQGNGENDEGGIFSFWRKKKVLNNTDISPPSLSSVAYPFTFKDVQRTSLFSSWTENQFWLYIRVVNLSNNEPASQKWTYFLVAKQFEIVSSGIQIEGQDGYVGSTQVVGTRDPETGIFEYTDDRPIGENTNQDGEVNINGSSVSPQAFEEGVNNYDPTEPTTSNLGYGNSINNLSETLSSLVAMVGQVPNMISEMLSFLPAWVITLIATSIAMMVVIGVIKTLT